MLSIPPDQLDPFLKLLAGMLAIAGFTNWMFMGVLAIQIFIFFLSFPEDRLSTKLLVFVLATLEILQSVLVSRDIYTALVTVPSTNRTALNSIQNHWVSIPIVGGVSGSIGQLFFAYRIWSMSQQSAVGHMRRYTAGTKTPSIIVATLALASLGSALAAAVVFFRAKTFSVLLGVDDDPTDAFGSLASIGVWNGIGAICDLVIALSMPYYLMRNGTGLRRTHIRLVGVVRLVIETGFFTAVVAILHLCLYFGGTPAFLVPGLTLSKVYANTTLLLLNNRKSIRDAWASDRGGGSSDNRVPETPTSAYNAPFPGRRLSRHEPGRPRATIMVSNSRLTVRLADPLPSPRPVHLPTSSSEIQLQVLESKLSQGTSVTNDS